MASDNVIPKGGPPAADFGKILDEAQDWVNTIRCAWHGLVASDAVDGCEEASRARNTVKLCERNLDRLMQELDVCHRREAPHG